FAQEATATGTITDSTGGVLPGVTVTAANEESGNTFVAVTDGEGRFRLPLRIGTYRISAELSGFATVSRTGLQMQVGQLAAVNAQPPDAPLHGAGDAHRHRRGAAHQHHDVDRRCQYRSTPDAGAAAQRPQLARPHAACAGQPREHRWSNTDP